MNKPFFGNVSVSRSRNLKNNKYILLYEKYTRNDEKNSVHNFIHSLNNILKLQILLTLKKNFTFNRSIHHPSLKCSKKYPSSSTIFEQLNFQFVTSLSLPQIHSTQPLYPPIFIHPFNERRSKFQASHPRISFDRELKGIDWITPKAPSWFFQSKSNEWRNMSISRLYISVLRSTSG